MREILFRGKRIDNGAWVNGFYLSSTDFASKGISVITVDKPRIPHYVSTDTIGQFTGLTDKNGKRIFEGDILDVEGVAYRCRWDDGNFEFGLVNKEESFSIAYAPHCIKIIGNIHDNPELLEVGNG